MPNTKTLEEMEEILAKTNAPIVKEEPVDESPSEPKEGSPPSLDEETIKELEAEIEKRKEELKQGLVKSESLDESVEVVHGSNKRDSTRASEAASANDFDRKGMSFGGPRRRQVKQARTMPDKVARLEKRKGVFHPFDNRPVKDIGDGTVANDIPKKRGKNE